MIFRQVTNEMERTTTRPSMVFSEKKEKTERIGPNHSIESALIQASSKGYTIDMILGNHERNAPKYEGDEKLAQSSSDDEGRVKF